MEDEKVIRELKRELRLTRVCSIVTLLLVLGLAAGVYFFYSSLRPTLELIDTLAPALEQVSEADLDALNEFATEAEPVLEQLSEIDADAINEMLESFDPEELQTTLDNLNDALEVINSLSEKMSSLGSLFR